MGVFWITVVRNAKMANLEVNVSMNRCQHVAKDQNKSSDQWISDQSWIRKFSVVTVYLMQIRKPPSPPPNPICWNVAMANANIASLPGYHVPKCKEWRHLFLWLPCQYLLLPIHHSLRGHVHEAQLRVLINCSWCLKHITLEHSLKAEPQKGVSSMGKAQDENLEWLLPEKVKGKTINGTPSSCKRPS